jgi:5-carboxymethyl-2-hydroxymuconate isomerase
MEAMPHLTLEYSANLPPEVASVDLLHRLHGTLDRVAGVRVGNCKSRARAVSPFVVGDREPDGAFVHLDVRLMEGRPIEVRQALGDALLALLVEAYGADRAGLQVTVEIGEIARQTYFKYPAGTLSQP